MADLIDTLLNLKVFAFFALLFWLATKKINPIHRDDVDDPK